MESEFVYLQFRRWLQDGSGERLEDFLGGDQVAAALDLSATRLRNLLLEELGWRHRQGRTTSLEDLQRRFPGNLQWVESAWQEYLLRLQDRGESVLPEVLVGRYRRLDRLGRGGFAEVWKCEDLKLGRLVAVKISRPDVSQSTWQLEEPQKLMQLKVRGIPEVYDTFMLSEFTPPVFCMVCEYVEGRTLAEEKKRRQEAGLQHDWNWIANLIAEVAELVQQFHHERIWHFDLKPGNILIDQQEVAWIVDFGLAIHDLQRLQLQPGYLEGTLLYMSPEQVQGLDRHGLSDIWSLGVILYELLTGKPPFAPMKPESGKRRNSDQERKAIIEAIVRQSPPTPRLTNSEIPNELSEICMRCLHKEPKQRPRSAGDLAGDLRSWLSRRRISPNRLRVPFDAEAAQQAQHDWSRKYQLGGRQTVQSGVPMQLIPPGIFPMGSSAGEGEETERPQHIVEISRPFLLSTTCVTQRLWYELMGSAPWKGRDFVCESERSPAVYVSWNDARDFCDRMKARDGGKWRLPTEAEWEYACRAGTETRYSFGDFPGLLSDYAWWGWMGGEGNCSATPNAREVGKKQPNAFGLYDMHGNVWEWCWDEFIAGYDDRVHNFVKDPLREATVGANRVCRGGAWRLAASAQRSATRYGLPLDFVGNHVGFRVVMELEG